ncbi:ATP-binding protein [Streptomyces sp. NBC_00344]|uniref:ATP-binding protein n=1 Tax=Streptomyces sp. NBC_00344 TaxID=2975720 RepID=UPI002E1DA6DE
MTSADLNPADPGATPAGVLLGRLGQLRDRVTDLVARRSATDPTAADPLRGLYLSDEAVRQLLRPHAGGGADVRPGEAGVPGIVADAGPAGPPDGDRLRGLSGRLGLTPLDTAILLLALAPDLDRAFEPLYGYLNDDVSRRRTTIGLAVELCGLPSHDPSARARFHPSAPLLALGLVRVEEPERPFLSRVLSVPDRVAAYLLGDDTPDAALTGHARLLPARPVPADAAPPDALVGRLAALLADGSPTVYLRADREGDALVCATAALSTAGLEALHFTPGNGTQGGVAAAGPAPGGEDRGGDGGAWPLLPVLLREARLRGCAIVVAPVPGKPGPLLRALAGGDVPVLLAGARPYDPHWCDSDPLVIDAPRQRAGDLGAWTDALGLPEGAGSLGFDLAQVVAPYRLDGDRIRRTARAGLQLAAFDGAELSAAHLRLAARQQSASGLEQHARRIRPDVGWADLVLPERPLAQLHELALRARHRDRVLGDWRLSAGGGRGRGALALFAGDSGTGKTLSAEVVAAELGLDLYVVQLSSVVDKYVGETEKNLERIFTEADRTDAVLLFDEADAVFGKRSEVTSSNDRYANLESAYLLQRLESFDGIVLLTTNLRANIDEAFTRRLDLIVDFPFPDADQRLALWQHSLAHVPCADDIDPGRCAKEFELAGGSIRSAVVTAAYAAAGRGSPVATADLLKGARREYRKAGRLVLDDSGGW